ncbi:MAG: methionine-S-sulfoxide reductase [Deltaproteobacteria bacterium]|jgi:methionine-S-sulfoxide reductase|nr:methionine-S-sulfoxide reductase [Deltaproteobacteria bacterium]
MDGVIRTRVGYAGGSKADPTYHDLGDHAETLQIDYDPTRISYRDLLDIFWQSHTPTRRPWSRQYASIIFFQNEEEKRLAIETRDREEERRGTKIQTEILPYSRFHLAEAYHQKYRLQQERRLMREFALIYPDPLYFVHSTAAARVNGYLSGYGTRESLERELGTLGLSSEAQRTLVERVSSSSPH